MRKRRREHQLEGIDAILVRAGEDRYAPRLPPISLVAWRSAVGPRIADQTVPLSLENGVLVVRTSSSTWASELSMLSETILARLRQSGIHATRLLFRTGRVELPQRPVERRATREVPPPVEHLPSILRRELEGVADDDLRESIRAAAARSLAYEESLSGSQRGARAPRAAETKSAPPDRAERPDPAAAPRNREGGRGRSR